MGSRDILAELFEGTKGVFCDPVKKNDTDCCHRRCEFNARGRVERVLVFCITLSLSLSPTQPFTVQSTVHNPHTVLDDEESIYDGKIV